jgi:hypothetical protein
VRVEQPEGDRIAVEHLQSALVVLDAALILEGVQRVVDVTRQITGLTEHHCRRAADLWPPIRSSRLPPLRRPVERKRITVSPDESPMRWHDGVLLSLRLS